MFHPIYDSSHYCQSNGDGASSQICRTAPKLAVRRCLFFPNCTDWSVISMSCQRHAKHQSSSQTFTALVSASAPLRSETAAISHIFHVGAEILSSVASDDARSAHCALSDGEYEVLSRPDWCRASLRMDLSSGA